MAAASPAGMAFYHNVELPHTSSLFLNVDSAIYSTFGENSSLFNSPGMSWSSDAYPACSSSFAAATFFGLSSSPGAPPLPDELVFPTEEDLLLGGDTSEFLQQLHGCNQPVMHPNLVHTLKNLVTPGSPESGISYFEQSHYRSSQQHSVMSSEPNLQGRDGVFLAQQHLLADSSQLSPNDGTSLSSQSDVTVAVDSEPTLKHVPPPLNMKRLEKVEDPCDDNIEAAEVSVDLIQNRRPFRCGQEGCNKTFKNPQTMKMHHKTHYTDGSALGKDGLATLPTLTPSLKAGQNKKIPSRCPKCRKTFVGLYELRRHYGRKHSEGEKPFGCRKCAKKFYIEVDVRDHEKLCGEPIECKCGLKFAFKCNLVAHKKAHPACQDPNSSTNSNNSSTTTTTSDEASSQSRSPPTLRQRGTKRPHRSFDDASSSFSSCTTSSQRFSSSVATPAPAFKCLPPENMNVKAARYDFAGLQFSTDRSSLWSSNMDYPSVNFANLPLHVPSSMYSSVLGGLEQLGSQMYQRKGPFVGHFEEFSSKWNCDPAGHSAMVRLS